jgi:hypothetical protein
MVLACVLFALITVGIVVPCVIDAATSPPWAVRTLARRDWLLVIVACSIFGCAAWLIAGRPRRMPLARSAAVPGMGQAEAFRRHPAGRARDLEPYEDFQPGYAEYSAPLGPDDDEEFLMELERRIRESRGEDR